MSTESCHEKQLCADECWLNKDLIKTHLQETYNVQLLFKVSFQLVQIKHLACRDRQHFSLVEKNPTFPTSRTNNDFVLILL